MENALEIGLTTFLVTAGIAIPIAGFMVIAFWALDKWG